MELNNRRVLITGGAGFIGSNLANHFAKNNDVLVVDNGFLGTPDNLRSDVTYLDQCVLETDLPTDVDVVFHLAALSSYRMHEENASEGAQVNVEGFVNVVEQARQDGCDTVVYASTSSIYGSRTEPTPEDVEITVNTGYEASKMAREQYAEYFSNHYNMSLAGLRYFSVYQGYDGAEKHKGTYANVIAQFADAIANGDQPVIFGDGQQTRDFIHVSDVISATECAAIHELNGVYNVGTGKSYSFNSVVERLNVELGTNIDPEYIQNPIPDSVYVHDTCADSSKLKAETSWNPQIGLREGIRRVCAPYQND